MDGPPHRIIYLASRDSAYARIRVVREALKTRFSVTEIVSSRKRYPARMAEVLLRFMACDRASAEVLVVGFLAQPLLPFLRPFWKGPIVSDALISLKDTLIDDRKRGRPGSPLDRMASALDRYMVRKSDVVFCDTSTNVRYFQSHFGPTEARFRRVWVGAPDLPPGVSGQRNRNRPDGPLRVFFYGSFIPLQGTDVIIEAARRLAPREAVFRIAGDGPLLDRAKDAAVGHDHITFIGWQTETQLIEEMLAADVCLGVFGSSDKASRVIPNKAYGALQLGVPLLTGDSPGIRELLEPGSSVIICPMSDPDGLVGSLRWSAANRPDLERIGAAGSDVFQREATTERLTPLIVEPISEVIDRRRRAGKASANR